jgi:truncated hemoglobin YjbI
MTLYQRIGEQKISEAVTNFYDKAFHDHIIGHFFFGKNKEDLTKKQISFAINFLGGPKRYQGRSLEAAHAEFSIRNAHFDRRQTLMREVLEQMELPKHDIDEWLVMEDSLRRLIVTVVDACNKVQTPNPQ